MKGIKRVLTALLAMAMALSLSAPAFAVSEDIRQKYSYSFESDPLGIFQHENRGYSSATAAALAESYGEDTEEYLYALAKAGIITILIRNANWFEIYAGPDYPGGNGSVSIDAERGRAVEYRDVAPEAWYYDAVMEATRGGLVAGDETGAFRPDGKVTVSDFTTILCRVYNLPVHMFDGPWYGPYIDAVAVAGLDFSSCRYEQATEEMTRGEAIEAMTVMLRAYGGEPARALTWDDVEDAEACGEIPAAHGWNAQALLDALNYGVIDGVNEAHRVDAASPFTRAELCKVLQNIGIMTAKSVDSYKAHEIFQQYTQR